MLLSKQKHGFLEGAAEPEPAFRLDAPDTRPPSPTFRRVTEDEGYSSPLVRRSNHTNSGGGGGGGGVVGCRKGATDPPRVWPPPSCQIAGHCTKVYLLNSPYAARRPPPHLRDAATTAGARCTHTGHLHKVWEVSGGPRPWPPPPTAQRKPPPPVVSVANGGADGASVSQAPTSLAAVEATSTSPPDQTPAVTTDTEAKPALSLSLEAEGYPLPDDGLASVLRRKVRDGAITREEAEQILRVTHLAHAAVEGEDSVPGTPPRSPRRPAFISGGRGARPKVASQATWVVGGKLFLSVGTSALGPSQYRRLAHPTPRAGIVASDSEPDSDDDHNPNTDNGADGAGVRANEVRRLRAALRELLPIGRPARSNSVAGYPSRSCDTTAASVMAQFRRRRSVDSLESGGSGGELTELPEFPPPQAGWARQPSAGAAGVWSRRPSFGGGWREGGGRPRAGSA